MFGSALKKFFGTKHDREIKKLGPLVDAIAQQESKLKKLSDADLQAKTGEFKQKIDNGATLDDLLVPAFAVVREAGRRVLAMRHYDVQMIGGIVLHQGKIAEMRTGEGKTLVATLPCYLNALSGKGVHVVTVNDYLAQRDAEWMAQLHNFLGLSVGVVVPSMRNAPKKKAYACDITYGQNNEFGFDYMRDNMKFSIYDYAQRELNFAIVDEVDSILIDEARTPLIISGPGETASDKYMKIAQLVPKLRKDEHYEIDEKARQATLTEEGIVHAQRVLFREGITDTENLFDPVNLASLHILQQSIRALTLYQRDTHYMVSRDGEVLIIDEFTGRVLPGRRWSDGLHQAVEAKERVPIQDESVTLATISFQNLFRLYNKLSGMTGTADTEATEFHKIYELDTVVIPTNKPIVRDDQDDLVYKTEREKFRAVADEIEKAVERGVPVLVGTTSVEKSAALARLLAKRDVKHEVLNAKQHEREAYIVAQAGTAGAVTVATNMAGRGTDIILGGNPEMIAEVEVIRDADPETLANKEDLAMLIEARTIELEDECKKAGQEIKDRGGLFIIGTERHESRRVDNQLRGRAGRQGDPGRSRFYLSLEDDLMRIFAGDKVQGLMDRLGMEEGIPIEHRMVTKSVENAQKKVEERNFDIRKNLLEYDDVMNQQRKSIYTLRKQVLRGEYRTVLTDEEKKAGQVPQRLVASANEKLKKRAEPILEQMVKLHSAKVLAVDNTPQEIAKARQIALEADLHTLDKVRTAALEKDVYTWFGCVVPLAKWEDDPAGVFEMLVEEVGMSLTEQYERMLDMADELIGAIVEKTCPENKHYEDWDIDTLVDEYEEIFDFELSGIDDIADRQAIATKLYDDAEAILVKRVDDFRPENFLRLFRNFYLKEIDRQWIEHLQAMVQLRDGIGLRGYGQRDPKKEYKKEGFSMFGAMTVNTKASVIRNMFTVQQVREEDLKRLEEQRRQAAEERQKSIEARRSASVKQQEARGQAVPAGAVGNGGQQQQPQAMSRRDRRRAVKRGQVAPEAAAAAPVERTVKREAPKVGRNDPCHCGSGKKYKSCHMREDRAGAEA